MSEQISTREQNSPAKKRSDSIWLGVVLIVMGFISAIPIMAKRLKKGQIVVWLLVNEKEAKEQKWAGYKPG